MNILHFRNHSLIKQVSNFNFSIDKNLQKQTEINNNKNNKILNDRDVSKISSNS